MRHVRIEANDGDGDVLCPFFLQIDGAFQSPVHIQLDRAIGAAGLDVDGDTRPLEEQRQHCAGFSGAHVAVGWLRLPAVGLLRPVIGHFQRRAGHVSPLQGRGRGQRQKTEGVQREGRTAGVDAHFHRMRAVDIEAADVERDDPRHSRVVVHRPAQFTIYVDIRRATTGEDSPVDGDRIGTSEVHIDAIVGARGLATGAVGRARAIGRGQADALPASHVGDLGPPLFPEALKVWSEVAPGAGVNDAAPEAGRKPEGVEVHHARRRHQRHGVRAEGQVGNEVFSLLLACVVIVNDRV